MIKTMTGQRKTELTHRRVSWETKQSLELVTLEWKPSFNHRRMLEPIRYALPSEAEASYRQLALKTGTLVSY